MGLDFIGWFKSYNDSSAQFCSSQRALSVLSDDPDFNSVADINVVANSRVSYIESTLKPSGFIATFLPIMDGYLAGHLHIKETCGFQQGCS